ncbi:MAG: MotA/TolQ/ExbB proton channel family protein [Fibrobacteria bacterium]|nr:MotA/TolQ/ExbB proton channel family protein [Fibrobacteria bacterium]
MNTGIQKNHNCFSPLLFFCIITLLAGLSWSAEKEVQAKYAKLQQELESLQALQSAKQDALEKAEAERWDQRYKQTASARQHEDRSRSIENGYTRLASEMGRMQDELVREENDTRTTKTEWEDTELRAETFKNLLSGVIDRESGKVSSDIPVGIAERTLALSSLSTGISEKGSHIRDILNGYFNYRLERLQLTREQELSSRMSFLGEKETDVWRLRLGTVAVLEKDRSSSQNTQILLRTGRLQGKVFTWRTQLAENYNQKIATTIQSAVDGNTTTNITLDILQNKSVGSGFISSGPVSMKQRVIAWFKKGGLVMYPLMLAALFGLFFSLERLFILLRKARASKRFMKRLRPFLDKADWQGATAYCGRSGASLSNIISGILRNVNSSRDVAEKAAKESMLTELPILEKRMVLIAAIGGSAPLMGLLGTVSGMISLFKVITDVGTNDPRILAGGISEALVTTQTGLIIAIPILLIHGYLSDRLERVQNDIASGSIEVLNKIWPDGE